MQKEHIKNNFSVKPIKFVIITTYLISENLSPPQIEWKILFWNKL